MIKFRNFDIYGWEAAIRGMRNPMNSWEKSDSWFEDNYDTDAGGVDCHNISGCRDKFFDIDDDQYFTYDVSIGPNDHKLMMQLAKGGSVHAKYRRIINVTVDILAPLYWWKEFDTYKVGTVANSCSTMHKIQAKEFTLEDFSHEHLITDFEYPDLGDDDWNESANAAMIDEYCLIDDGEIDDLHCDRYAGEIVPIYILEWTVAMLNRARDLFLKTNDKRYWWQMIQLLPSSYNQLRTVQLNYEVLAGIYISRKDHKLDEWRYFCKWIENLPYSEIITLNEED